jgi:hypothetical protein
VRDRGVYIEIVANVGKLKGTKTLYDLQMNVLYLERYDRYSGARSYSYRAYPIVPVQDRKSSGFPQIILFGRLN